MPGAKHYHRPADILTSAKSRPRRPTWQWALLGALALVLLVLVTCLVLALLPPGEIRPQGTATLGGLEGTMQRALMDLEAARLASSSGVSTQVWVTLSDADLNAYLVAGAAGRPLPMHLRQPRVAFREGRVLAGARGKLGFLPVWVTAEVVPTANDGRLRVNVERVRVGRLPLPRRYRKELALRGHNAVNSILHETDFRLEELRLTPGRLELALRPPRV